MDPDESDSWGESWRRAWEFVHIANGTGAQVINCQGAVKAPHSKSPILFTMDTWSSKCSAMQQNQSVTSCQRPTCVRSKQYAPEAAVPEGFRLGSTRARKAGQTEMGQGPACAHLRQSRCRGALEN